MDLWIQWVGGGNGRMNWESGFDLCTSPRVRQTAGQKLLTCTGSPAPCSALASRAGMRAGREVQERGVEWVYTADSRLCAAETNRIL